mmetsp:Transcript_1904/g.7240  ORF Transcript_1904/g.7240 Transcript_1904/m.7240 type:complete len:248 (+) Transcript_1904:5550-6293(+)
MLAKVGGMSGVCGRVDDPLNELVDIPAGFVLFGKRDFAKKPPPHSSSSSSAPAISSSICSRSASVSPCFSMSLSMSASVLLSSCPKHASKSLISANAVSAAEAALCSASAAPAVRAAATSAAAATGSRGAYFGISASASPYAQTVRSSEHAGGGHLSRAGKSSSGGTLGAIARWCCCAQSLPGSPLLDEPGSSEIGTMRGGASSDSLASPSPIGRAVSDPANENWDEENDLRTPLTPGGKTKRRMRR